MATSGTTTFNPNRDKIIKRALRQCQAFASGETPDAQSITDAAEALDAMIKEWNTLGIHLWTEAEGVLFLQANQAQYALGTGSADFATQTNPPNYTTTTLSANAAKGATSITVTSILNILSGDNIGILLDKGSIFWTTVNGAPSGSTVNLTVATTDSATSGNTVFDYTTAILRPLRIVDMRRYNISSGIETAMIKWSRLDYRDQPNKTNTGTPTAYFYDPLGGANTNGQVYIWPVPNPVADIVKFTWYRPIQDAGAAGNTLDFPQEWVNPITWNLALEISPEYDVPTEKLELIVKRAGESLERVMGWDRESESVYFGPALEYPQGRQ